jgi:hypothetical protein
MLGIKRLDTSRYYWQTNKQNHCQTSWQEKPEKSFIWHLKLSGD